MSSAAFPVAQGGVCNDTLGDEGSVKKPVITWPGASRLIPSQPTQHARARDSGTMRTLQDDGAV